MNIFMNNNMMAPPSLQMPRLELWEHTVQALSYQLLFIMPKLDIATKLSNVTMLAECVTYHPVFNLRSPTLEEALPNFQA